MIYKLFAMLDEFTKNFEIDDFIQQFCSLDF